LRAVYRDAKHRLSGRRARGQRGLHKNHADAVRGRTLVRALSIEGISKSEVSRICSALDAEVRAFRSRPRQHLGCATGERHEVDDVVSTGDLLEALRDASRAAELAERLAQSALRAAEPAERDTATAEEVAILAEEVAASAEPAARSVREAARKAAEQATTLRGDVAEADLTAFGTKASKADARGRDEEAEDKALKGYEGDGR